MNDNKQIEILLIEDSPEDIELAMYALRQEKLANPVHIVRDGEEALNFLFGSGSCFDPLPHPVPGLILLDLHLPKISGTELWQILKQDPRTQNIPVAILTGSHSQHPSLGQAGSDVNNVLWKPIDFDQLRKTVKRERLAWLLVEDSHKRPPSQRQTT